MPTGIYLRKKKGTIKKCIICDKKFYVFPWRKNKAKYCSYKCSYIGLKEYRSNHLKKHRISHPWPKGKPNPNAQKWWKENNPMKLEKNKIKVRGENNHNWRGGVCDRLMKLEWLQIRQMILERDKFNCQRCGLTHHEIILNVHHKIPYRINEDNSSENLITLCQRCHANITWREEHKLFIKLKGG